MTGCVSDELVKIVLAENIALSVTNLLQPVIAAGFGGLFGGLTT